MTARSQSWVITPQGWKALRHVPRPAFTSHLCSLWCTCSCLMLSISLCTVSVLGPCWSFPLQIRVEHVVWGDFISWPRFISSDMMRDSQRSQSEATKGDKGDSDEPASSSVWSKHSLRILSTSRKKRLHITCLRLNYQCFMHCGFNNYAITLCTSPAEFLQLSFWHKTTTSSNNFTSFLRF